VRFVVADKPVHRRGFAAGERVCERARPFCEGVVVIPHRELSFTRSSARRVKIWWLHGGGYYEWIDEDRLMSPDVITELGRLAEIQREIAQITAKLEEIKRTCPTSWTAAGRILYP
jgi:hypothetical protein